MENEYSIFMHEVESYKNGNITLFKKWLSTLNGETILCFIKWLQDENINL